MSRETKILKNYMQLLQEEQPGCFIEIGKIYNGTKMQRGVRILNAKDTYLTRGVLDAIVEGYIGSLEYLKLDERLHQLVKDFNELKDNCYIAEYVNNEIDEKFMRIRVKK